MSTDQRNGDPVVITTDKIPLSDRELQVITLLAEGMPTKEIGCNLGISPKTVETHRSKIIDKLRLLIGNGVRVIELTHFALALGLVKVRYVIPGKIKGLRKFREETKRARQQH